MTQPSNMRLAQIAIGVLLLVIVRSLGEYFRLQYLHGDALVVDQVTPFVAGALFAAVALAATMICYALRLYRDCNVCDRRDDHCAAHLQDGGCGLRR